MNWLPAGGLAVIVTLGVWVAVSYRRDQRRWQQERDRIRRLTGGQPRRER